jgi:hypothetical protein
MNLMKELSMKELSRYGRYYDDVQLTYIPPKSYESAKEVSV